MKFYQAVTLFCPYCGLAVELGVYANVVKYAVTCKNARCPIFGKYYEAAHVFLDPIPAPGDAPTPRGVGDEPTTFTVGECQSLLDLLDGLANGLYNASQGPPRPDYSKQPPEFYCTVDERGPLSKLRRAVGHERRVLVDGLKLDDLFERLQKICQEVRAGKATLLSGKFTVTQNNTLRAEFEYREVKE